MKQRLTGNKSNSHKTQSIIKTNLVRNSINNKHQADQNKIVQAQNISGFSLGNITISSNQRNIRRFPQLKRRKTSQKARLRNAYYKYRNGIQGKDINWIRMKLVKATLKRYRINTHNAQLSYVHNSDRNANASASYTLRQDNTIDQTFIRFYPRLFKLPFNSFINTIRHEAYHVALFHRGIFDRNIQEFLAESKEILSKHRENPLEFSHDANRALKHWINIFKETSFPDFQKVNEEKLIQHLQKIYDRIVKRVQKRYAKFINEYGTEHKSAKLLEQLVKRYKKHRP